MLHAPGQIVVADQQARFDQVGDDGDVVASLFQAIGHGAHAAAHFQADVPEEGKKLLQPGLLGGHRLGFDQQQQVDVRMRQQLAAPVAAGGDQRQTLGCARQVALPGAAQYFIHQEGIGAHERFGAGVALEQVVEPLAAPVESVAECRDRLACAVQARAYAPRTEDRFGFFVQVYFSAHRGNSGRAWVRASRLRPGRRAGSESRIPRRSPAPCARTGRTARDPW